MRFEPHEYQQHAVQWVLDKPACGLFLGMGLGKTAVTLTALVELLHDRFEVVRPLVIAPLRVAQSTWPDETEKWDHLQHLRVSKVLGSQQQRLAALQDDADLWVANRENVKWLVELYGRGWPFDMIIVDELSSFKSPSSQRFRALRKVRPLARRVVGLTGTPAPNGLIDLWSQVYLLDRGERLGKTLTEYRERWFTPGRRNGYVVYEWVPRPFAEEEIYERISDICVSMRSEDWLQLPERLDRVVAVKLSPEARATYRRMEREMLLPFVGADVVAGSAAVLTNKLLQLANGAVYDEEGGVRYIHDCKLDVLEDLVEAANGRPVMVAYSYRHDLARIKQRFPMARELEGPEDVRAWNRGEVSILLTHPASAGHGLNLQAGGNTLIWFGLPWSLELYQQAVARLHRQGQTERVVVHHLLAEGTMDGDVMRALSGKATTQGALLEAVKARIGRVKTCAV